MAHAQPLWRYIYDILGYWVTTAGIMHKPPHEIAEAYIQPVPYCTDETVKSDLNRLMLLVDDTQIPISGQAYVRHC